MKQVAKAKAKSEKILRTARAKKEMKQKELKNETSLSLKMGFQKARRAFPLETGNNNKKGMKKTSTSKKSSKKWKRKKELLLKRSRTTIRATAKEKKERVNGATGMSFLSSDRSSLREVEEPEPSQSSDEEGSALTNMVPDEIEPEEVGNEGPVPSQSHDNGSPVSGYEELSNSGEVPPKNPLTRSSQVPANEVVSSPANSVHRSCSVETEPAYIESPDLGPEDAGRTMSPRDFEREKRQLATFSRDLGYEKRYVVGNAFDFSKPTGSFSTNAAGQGVVKSTPRKLISNNFDIDFLMANHSVEEQAQERVPETSTPQVVKMKDGVAVLAQPRKQRNQPPRAVPLAALDQASSSGASSSRQPQSVASPDDMPGGSGTFFDPVHQVKKFACLICQKPYVDPTRIDQHSEKAHGVTDLSSLLGAFYNNQEMINRISVAVTQQVATARNRQRASGTFGNPSRSVQFQPMTLIVPQLFVQRGV
ncbi:unnamed protein product [Caenorhabditis auriculariae]|uniref:C2H2-type domain-containing protein n=1 Tax=Caenorhabditis auriculariae TaxID=2777116 RepID=A0A8S1HUM7_9PELO|nr:unnamed protein product [Caenorhabditis auriculariae]